MPRVALFANKQAASLCRDAAFAVPVQRRASARWGGALLQLRAAEKFSTYLAIMSTSMSTMLPMR